MKPIIQAALLALWLCSPSASAAETAETQAQQYLSISVDRVEIDTEGLSLASGRLAASIDRLGLALQQLSVDSEALGDAEKKLLLDAVESVDEASAALTRLAQELPQTADRLGARLPQLVQEARQPVAELSAGLASARDGIYAITESLPQATENAKQLVDAALDAALVKISIYSVILIAVLALALIGVMWFVYRQYLDPLARKLDALTGAPEHFAAMALHMQKTSENLLALQAEVTEAQPGETESPSAEPPPDREPEAAGEGAGPNQDKSPD